MGTRAHQRIISKTKYEGCSFSNEMEYVADILNQYSCDNNIYDDTNILKDTWEIPIENLKEVIKGLKNNYKLDDYLPKLVRAGNRVAICEELPKPETK